MISAANLCGYSIGALATGRSGGRKNRAVIFVFSCTGVLLLAVLLSDRWLYFLSIKPVLILLILFWGILNGAIYPLLSKHSSEPGGSGIRSFLSLSILELAGSAVGAAITGMILLGSAGFYVSMLIVIAALGCNMLSVYIRGLKQGHA